MQTVQTDLTILGAHTEAPLVYWKGQQVIGVESIFLHSDPDEQRLKLFVRNGNEIVLAEMSEAGIKIRRV